MNNKSERTVITVTANNKIEALRAWEMILSKIKNLPNDEKIKEIVIVTNEGEVK